MASLKLTTRQIEILSRVALGDTDKEIARRLDVNLGTVKCHMRSVAIKLNARTRTHAVALHFKLTPLLEDAAREVVEEYYQRFAVGDGSVLTGPIDTAIEALGKVLKGE